MEAILTYWKSAKWLSILNCSKSAKWPVWKFIYLQSWRKIKFGQQVNLILRVPLVPCLRRKWCYYLIIMWPWQIFISSVIERLQGLHWSMQTLKSSLTYCVKYLLLELLAGSCICTWNKLIKVKGITSLTFFFKFFSDTKT